MSIDYWVGLLLLLASLALLVISAAGEGRFLANGRLRAQHWANRAASDDDVRRYIAERRTFLSALALAKGLAVAASTALALFLVFDWTGHSWLALGVTLVAAVVLLTLLQGVATATVNIAPDHWLRYFSPFLTAVRVLFGPPAKLLARHGETTPLEEFFRLIEAQEEAPLEEGQHMIRRIISLPDTTAREIMVPRVDIVALEASATMDDAIRLILERGKSRIPLYQGTIDNIIGIVYAKDILRALYAQPAQASGRSVSTQPAQASGRSPAAQSQGPDLSSLARRPYFVPETKRVHQLLGEIRRDRIHMAIVVDEYGGVAGLLTIEDLLEEIVGEIEDEYDVAERQVEQIGENEAIVDARLGLDTFNELFDQNITSDDYDTLGGFLYSHLGKMPSAGDEVEVDGLRLKVLSVAGRRIRKVRVVRELPSDNKRAASDDASP